MDTKYSVAKAAKRMQISQGLVYQLVASGELRVVPYGLGRIKPRYWIMESEIKRWESARAREYLNGLPCTNNTRGEVA